MESIQLFHDRRTACFATTDHFIFYAAVLAIQIKTLGLSGGPESCQQLEL